MGTTIYSQGDVRRTAAWVAKTNGGGRVLGWSIRLTGHDGLASAALLVEHTLKGQPNAVTVTTCAI
jgi:hypothetical protein